MTQVVIGIVLCVLGYGLTLKSIAGPEKEISLVMLHIGSVFLGAALALIYTA